jgi:hypothetical protein
MRVGSLFIYKISMLLLIFNNIRIRILIVQISNMQFSSYNIYVIYNTMLILFEYSSIFVINLLELIIGIDIPFYNRHLQHIRIFLTLTYEIHDLFKLPISLYLWAFNRIVSL